MSGDHTLIDMSDTHAKAWTAATENEFAAPAREATRQAEDRTAQEHEATKQHYATAVVIGGIAAGILALLAVGVSNGQRPDTGLLASLLGLALLAMGGPTLHRLAAAWAERHLPRPTERSRTTPPSNG